MESLPDELVLHKHANVHEILMLYDAYVEQHGPIPTKINKNTIQCL